MSLEQLSYLAQIVGTVGVIVSFELTGGALLCRVLRTPRGGAWWHGARNTGFIPGFILDVDAMLAKGGGPDYSPKP